MSPESVRSFSLRRFLAFVAICGVLVASMRMGGAIAKFTVVAIGVFATGQLIVAFVGLGERRAFAIGFSIPFVIYIAIHYGSDQDQLNPADNEVFHRSPLYLLAVLATCGK